VGDQDVVRHREFDRFREDLRRELDRRREDDQRRFERIEQDIEDLQSEHDTDMLGLARQHTTELQQASARRERRREWTWGQIAVTAGLAIAVAGLLLQALGR
jgi:hypothetical protein